VHDESTLLARLREGDEQAFEGLIARHDGALRRVARTYLRTDAAVDDVVQETWLGVVRGLDRFEGRSSLRTWIFSILVNRARTRAVTHLSSGYRSGGTSLRISLRGSRAITSFAAIYKKDCRRSG